MRTAVDIGLLFSVIIFSCNVATAAKLPVPAPPVVNATSYLLIDFDSGELLAEKNSKQRLAPASLTKLMTAYVIYSALEDGTLSRKDITVISEKAWRMRGSRMFVEVDSVVSIDDLLWGLVVQSGNDASVALAEALAGSEQQFAVYMNNQAARLGMQDSNFVNSTGLPKANHYSTAADMAILVRALIRNFPEEYKRYSTRDFTYNDIQQFNRNKLLWRDQSVDGVKTGHTKSAGYCLIASAKRKHMRLISVVLNSKSEKSRISDSQRLLEYGFRFYSTRLIAQQDQILAAPRVWKANTKTIAMGVKDDIYLTVLRSQRHAIKTVVEPFSDIVAPIATGDVVGRLKVTIGQDEDAQTLEYQLVALQSVRRGNIIHRLRDTVIRFFLTH